MELYQALAENSLDIMLFIQEPTGRILEANRAAMQAYGLSHAELTQKTIFELRHASTLGEVAGQMQQASAQGARFETVHRRRDGSPFPVEVSSQGLTLGRDRLLLSVIRDITERKQMEQELAWLASFPQLDPNPIAEVDLAGSVQFLNRAAESALPGLKQRGPEHPWLAEWESVGRAFRDLQTSVRQREAHVGNSWYLQTMHYVPEIQRVRIYGVDITERKLAEGSLREAMRALAESEQHFRGLFETMLQGVVYQDAQGAILSMNPAAERILGKTKAEFLGQSSVSVEHDTQREDGSPFPDLEHPAMVALRTGRQVREAVMRVYHPKEQQYRSITITAVPLFRAGEHAPYQVYTVFDDITERMLAEETLRESEKRYRSLFENMLEGFAFCRMLFEHDRPEDFVYLDVNSAFEDLTGLKNVVGKRVTEVIPGIRESNPESFEVYGRVATSGHPEKLEVHLETLGIWLSVSVYSTEKETFVAVFDNITARKRAEAEQRRLAEERDQLLARLQELNADLEQRVRERTAKLTEAQQQLSQREASLRALVHRRAEAQESERAYVADQLYNEAAQVLAVVQIQHGRLERELARGQASPELWAELKDTVDRVLSELHHLAVHLRPATLDRLGLVPALEQYLAEFGSAHQLQVHFVAVSMEGARVPTEVATVLYRVVQEALANVARHAQATHVSVLVRRSDSHVSIMVEDDGIGFDVGEALRRGALGLLGMRERAEALSGCLEVESTKEGRTGTTVVVEVPLDSA